MSLLTPDIGLLFWMLVSFGAVFFVLARFGFPVIVKMVEERKSFIDKSLDAALQANERLAGIQQESERILKHAREEELRILKEAEGMKNRVIEEAKIQAIAEGRKLIEEAQTAVRKEREMALRDLRNRMAVLSVGIAEKILRRNLDNRAAQQKLVEQLIEEAQMN
jgi:F-type H+-transporting ATPase subunit b